MATIEVTIHGTFDLSYDAGECGNEEQAMAMAVAKGKALAHLYDRFLTDAAREVYHIYGVTAKMAKEPE